MLANACLPAGNALNTHGQASVAVLATQTTEFGVSIRLRVPPEGAAYLGTVMGRSTCMNIRGCPAPAMSAHAADRVCLRFSVLSLIG